MILHSMAKGRKYGSLTQRELKNARHAIYASLLKQGLVIGRKIGGGGGGRGEQGERGIKEYCGKPRQNGPISANTAP